MKILLLEDDLELCKNIKISLEKENYMVDCCNDGETAMLYALNTDYAYDLAIVDRIFDRFYSGDKSHANKANFGLGLSIAKELTQMLNGTITINDTVGGGATFTVKFPLK